MMVVPWPKKFWYQLNASISLKGKKEKLNKYKPSCLLSLTAGLGAGGVGVAKPPKVPGGEVGGSEARSGLVSRWLNLLCCNGTT